jgi:enoyl-CoA hydratase/carnithine racemase
VVDHSRLKACNSLNKAVRDGLTDWVLTFIVGDPANMLVATGAGDETFCAGGDVKEMATERLSTPPVDFVSQFGCNVRVDSQPSPQSTAPRSPADTWLAPT